MQNRNLAGSAWLSGTRFSQLAAEDVDYRDFRVTVIKIDKLKWLFLKLKPCAGTSSPASNVLNWLDAQLFLW
jgi:hypothetical protein